MSLGISSSLSGTSGHYDPIITWEETFTANGTFVVPTGVYEVSVVCVGGGGGGFNTTSAGAGGSGGDLRWIRRLAVTPNESLTVVVGTAGIAGAPATPGGFTEVLKASTLATITTATSASGNTVYTSNGHKFEVGDVINVTGVTPVAYNGFSLTITSKTVDTFTVVKTSSGTYSSGGTAVKVLLTAAGGAAGTADDLDTPLPQNGISTAYDTGTVSFSGPTSLGSALTSSTGTGLIGQIFTGRDFRASLPDGEVGGLPFTNSVSYQTISYNTLGDLYGFLAIGYFKPPTTGTYTFFTSSDDSSAVWVGDIASAESGRTALNAVVNNGLGGGSGQADTKRSGTISLIAGTWYAIRIAHEQGIGPNNLTFSWSGPGIAETTNLSTYFKPPVNIAGQPIQAFPLPNNIGGGTGGAQGGGQGAARSGGGGGAAGYSGNGGRGGDASAIEPGNPGTGGAGGGGGSGDSAKVAGGGGGVGLFGKGTNGAGGLANSGGNGSRGAGGSGGVGGSIISSGALYGAGGGGSDSGIGAGNGAQGGLRIIWGRGRRFPIANTRAIPRFPAVVSVSPTVIQYTNSTTFTVPTGVTRLSILAVGAGGGAVTGNIEMSFACAGGGGGGLAYGNDLVVTPGEELTIVVGAGGASVNNTSVDQNIFGGTGGTSSVSRSSTVLVGATGGGGGQSGWTQDSIIGGVATVFAGGAGGTGTGTSLTASFSGGSGGSSAPTIDLSDSNPNQGTGDSVRFGGAGGGGAAGYLGNGGAGAAAQAGGIAGVRAVPNSGGGGGGGSGKSDTLAGAGGGGVGINGLGQDGLGGAIDRGGTGGSGGGTGFAVVNGNRSGGLYGGGAGAGADRPPAWSSYLCNGANGAVVIAYGVSNFYPNALLPSFSFGITGI